jgi:D-alanyl-D-alanine dipeptidase
VLQVDCGSSFDYFDPVSHFSSSIIKPEQYNNRLMLRELMQQAGFIPYEKEWWHFRLDCDLSNYPGQDILIK